MEEKPKRVLTEAQRLAFLKGREKRMANIEKNRLAKLEFQEATKEDPGPPAVAPVPAPAPVPVPEPEPESKPEPKYVPAIITPPMPKLKRHARVKLPPTSPIDEDKIASIVADKIMAQMMPPPAPRKPRAPKIKTVPEEHAVAESKTEENKAQTNNPNVPPFVHNFSWL
jgi:hypothetical protein